MTDHAGVGGHVEDRDAERLAQFLAQSDAGGSIAQMDVDQGQFGVTERGKRARRG